MDSQQDKPVNDREMQDDDAPIDALEAYARQVRRQGRMDWPTMDGEATARQPILSTDAPHVEREGIGAMLERLWRAPDDKSALDAEPEETIADDKGAESASGEGSERPEPAPECDEEPEPPKPWQQSMLVGLYVAPAWRTFVSALNEEQVRAMAMTLGGGAPDDRAVFDEINALARKLVGRDVVHAHIHAVMDDVRAVLWMALFAR